MKIFYIITFSVITFTLISCSTGGKSTKESRQEKTTVTKKPETPVFNADSAYSYVDKQVAFGPRVPDTKPHSECAEYLTNELKRFGADVIVQDAPVTAYNGKTLNAKNIIGQYNPEKNNRVLLFAHWDSRPFADHDPDPAKRNTPILGANDGASGVGILLEIARQINKAGINIGVDIIFFDAEDYGTPDHLNLPYKPDTWCLGTQYWCRHPHKENYTARWGILLDMVGAPNAVFYKELYSKQYAPELLDRVWNTAADLGYLSFFSFEDGGQIIDDHVYVNKLMNIPSIDIIQHEPMSDTNFNEYWHTHKDDMSNIDRTTLKAVGQTVLQVLYSEN
ncbi:MAG: M28 family peptidase [Chlorobi bacterium]|nr:M28 family peptidase [Chlorobiota bacterium]